MFETHSRFWRRGLYRRRPPKVRDVDAVDFDFPASARVMPAIVCNSVVLPQPLLPTRTICSPRGNVELRNIENWQPAAVGLGVRLLDAGAGAWAGCQAGGLVTACTGKRLKVRDSAGGPAPLLTQRRGGAKTQRNQPTVRFLTNRRIPGPGLVPVGRMDHRQLLQPGDSSPHPRVEHREVGAEDGGKVFEALGRRCSRRRRGERRIWRAARSIFRGRFRKKKDKAQLSA